MPLVNKEVAEDDAEDDPATEGLISIAEAGEGVELLAHV